MKCQYCKSVCVKIGKQKDGTQKYRCKACKKYQQEEYKYQAKVKMKRELIVSMITNNMGFRNISEVLSMSFNTVHNAILKAAEKCRPPLVPKHGSYEVDEILAYHKPNEKQIWAAFAINKSTKEVFGINVGQRNKTMLRKTVNEILITQPKRIYSDGNPSYKSLIPGNIHRPVKRFLRFIERLNLTARNKLKMLNHKTLAFVRKEATLLACLKLLFWR